MPDTVSTPTIGDTQRLTLVQIYLNNALGALGDKRGQCRLNTCQDCAFERLEAIAWIEQALLYLDPCQPA